MASIKVPCPSCENQVSVAEKAIGTKVECPKCKYRFKAEEPAGGAAKDAKDPKDAKAGKDAKADKKKKVAAAPADAAKKKKKKLAVIVGVLAVLVLAAVGFAVLSGGGDTKKPSRPFVPPQNANKGGVTPGGDKEDPEPKPKDKDPGEVKKTPVAAISDKDPSNLLPNDTRAVYRFDLDKIKLTPLSPFFDPNNLKMFAGSFGVDADQVATYHHAFVGDTREPFGVINLKMPVFERDVVAAIAPTAGARPIKKKWTLYAFKSNPFANAVSNSFHFASLFGGLFDKLPAGPVKPAAGPRPFGLCVYDSQNILVGDHAALESFLSALDAKGLPKFLSAVGTPAAGQIQAENPLYLSLDPRLKRTLKDVGAETGSPPMVVYAEKSVQGMYDPKGLKTDYQPVTAVLDPVLTRTEYLAATVSSFTPTGITATLRLTMVSDGAAFEVIRDQLVPMLQPAADFTAFFLNSPVEARNLTTVGTTTPGTGPGGIGPRPNPPSENEEGPGTVRPQPGPGGILPKQPQPGGPSGGFISVAQTDRFVTVTADLAWPTETFRQKIEPRLQGVINTLKGKMAVYASDLSYYGLLTAIPKLATPPGQFPRGTADRRLTDASRLGLKYQPATRVSLFAELLPYLGRDREQLSRLINRDAAWYDYDPKANVLNLEAAEAWVPELLVPSYPQSAWRATSPFVAEGRVLGGTNYVAVAGVGLDIARQDPTVPEFAKKVGITGYNWGSKPEDVKDGLSNTIYLLQTPPGGPPQPWIAGGGATVRGLDPANPMRGLAHTYGTPDGKPGTFVLMGDGSVRFVGAGVSPKVLAAMATRAGDDGADLGNLDTAAPRVDLPKGNVELKTDPKPEPEPKKAADPKAADPKPVAKSDAEPKKSDGKTEPAPAPVQKK